LGHLIDRDDSQTSLGANVHAAAAQNATPPVKNRVHSAVEAAPRFRAGFRRLKPQLHRLVCRREAIGEGNGARGSAMAFLVPGLPLKPRQRQMQLHLLRADPLPGQLLVDRTGHRLPRGNRVNQQLRPVGQIAGHENVFGRGGPTPRVALDPAVVGQRKSVALGIEKGQIERLTNGKQDVVALQKVVGSFHRGRPTAAACVRLAQFHLLAPNPTHLPAIVLLNPDGITQQVESNAFFIGFIDLRPDRRHFTSGPAVDDVDLAASRAESRARGVHRQVMLSLLLGVVFWAGLHAQGGAGGVHRGVAAANHDHTTTE